MFTLKGDYEAVAVLLICKIFHRGIFKEHFLATNSSKGYGIDNFS